MPAMNGKSTPGNTKCSSVTTERSQRGTIMADRETFIVKVTDLQGRDLFTGSIQAATYHRALRIAWSETADDRPLTPVITSEPAHAASGAGSMSAFPVA